MTRHRRPAGRSAVLPARVLRITRSPLWLAALSLPLCATAAEVALPIQLDEVFLERLLVEQVFDEPGGVVQLSSGDGCGQVDLSPLGLTAEPHGLRVRARVLNRFGVPFAGLCWLTTEWEGELEVLQAPELDAERPVVHFRVRDSRWTATREPLWLPSERAYQLVRELVHPRLERFSVDLSQPFDELRSLLWLFWHHDHRDAAVRMARSLELTGVETQEDLVELMLRFDAPDAPVPPALAEPALTPEEIAAFDAAWQRWDAFLGFVVKEAGAEPLRREQRLALVEVLLDARFDLVAVLEAPPGQVDPVPALFVATWVRLAPVLRDLHTALPGDTALRYLAFVAAGDAVTALHALAPAGVEVSADGLRRLARLVAPAMERDPLIYSVEVDPALREMIDLGPPIPLPALPPRRPIAPSGSAPALPEGDAPVAPRVPEATVPPPSSGWLQLGRRLGRSFAALLASPASAEPLGFDPEAAASDRLLDWAPTRTDVQEYLPLAGGLLRRTAAQVASEDGLPEAWQRAFVPLVLATGWQESCWRQWVRKGGSVVPLRSRSGDVGILQVNVHVWRGFYDRDALNGDITYNARAGSEILRHYLVDHALRRLDAIETGDADLVARVVYALYNGGPRHLRRPIEGRSPALRAVDDAFFAKYRAARDGPAEEAVAGCY